MEKDGVKALGCLGATLGVLIGTVWGGWVLSVMWAWFIVPTFGAPTLSVVEAMAVGLLVNWLAKAYVPRPQDENPWFGLTVAVFGSFVTPAVVLVIGWVLRGFL